MPTVTFLTAQPVVIPKGIAAPCEGLLVESETRLFSCGEGAFWFRLSCGLASIKVKKKAVV
jgi:hypothetical protein